MRVPVREPSAVPRAGDPFVAPRQLRCRYHLWKSSRRHLGFPPSFARCPVGVHLKVSSNVVCSCRRSYGTRGGVRFAHVHRAILLDPAQLKLIR